MTRLRISAALAACASALASPGASSAQQAPWAKADTPVSSRDRIYAAEQFSNTVSVVDPSTNKLLGVIKLGDPQPMNMSPLYRGQVLVHGLGYSPDGRTLAVVSIASNSVSFIDTATNTVTHTTYVGRSPHEAFFTPDGSEVWVTVRGEDYVSVIDAKTFVEKDRVNTPGGPGMTIFSPDGRYAYVCSSFNPEIAVFETRSRKRAGTVAQPSPFCPNIAASPDGKQVWFTLKDVGRTVVFSAKPPFAVLKSMDTGPITNHVNFAQTRDGLRAYVTIGGENMVRVFTTDTFEQKAEIPVGALPHGVWPSGDGSRIYVGLENADKLAAIDTATNKVVAEIPIGQAPQAIAYVPRAVDGPATANLQPLGSAGDATRLTLKSVADPRIATSVTLFEQGLTQIVQAAAVGLQPKRPYVLALSDRADGSGGSQPLARFMTNPAGGAIVNATGPIRQIVKPGAGTAQRYLVIAEEGGRVVQVQAR